jgi:hypothetical protein
MTVSMNTTISTKKAVPQGDIGSGGVPSRRAGAAAAVGFAGIAAYQVALALGAPFGSAAWGGAHPGTLPPGLRVASDVGAALRGFAALIILQRVGLSSVLPFGRMFVRRATWVLVVLSCMSAVANFAFSERGGAVHLGTGRHRARRPLLHRGATDGGRFTTAAVGGASERPTPRPGRRNR